jgi:hypothetical protein
VRAATRAASPEESLPPLSGPRAALAALALAVGAVGAAAARSLDAQALVRLAPAQSDGAPLAVFLTDSEHGAPQLFAEVFGQPQLAPGADELRRGGRRRAGKPLDLDLGESFARAGDANYALSFSLIDPYPGFRHVTGIGWLVRSGDAIADIERDPDALFAAPRRYREPAIPEPASALAFLTGMLVVRALGCRRPRACGAAHERGAPRAID